MTDIRIARLREAMRAHGMDGVVIVPGAGMRYLTGLGLHTRLRLTALLIPAHGPPQLVLPAMEAEGVLAAMQTALALHGWDDTTGPGAALAAALAAAGLATGKIGIEPTVMRVFELHALEAALPAAVFADAEPVLTQLRGSKDARELAAIRAAVVLIERALDATLAYARVGMTEAEIARFWETQIRAAGGVPAFDLMVATGPNGARPHHTPGERRLAAGDLVVFDGGAVVDGYCSDITRTVAVGEVTDELCRIYDLVAAANAAGRAAAAQPGVSGDAIDAAARAVITAGGYGPQFLHRTGHGLGIEIHEPPFIVAGSDTPLASGAVFTIEPGIYMPGLGGVRIEDDLVMTAHGAETLTTFARALRVIAA